MQIRTLFTALALTVASSAAARAESVQQKIEAHLAFGEFTRAVELARTVGDDTDRSLLLGLVADAQMKVGDFDAALGSIRSMPDYNERLIAQDRRTEEVALAGGSQANFQQLIDLIMMETDGMWEEVDGQGGTMSQFDQGVRVEPNGVLRRLSSAETTGRLQDRGVQAREALVNGDIAQLSDLRVISLKQLEAAVAKRLEQGKAPTVSQQLLGGLTQVRHVFVYPDLGDVVLAGPAESWQYNAEGVPVGVESGRPVLQLDDLVTMLRAFSARGNQKFFSCSINPRPEGLKQLKDYVQQTSGRPLNPGAVRRWADTLQEKLGRQDIVYSGINPESRVARVIIEADYRMKLIGIGKYDFASASSKIPNIFDLMTVEERKSSKLDALRWWLTMKYDSVLHTPDNNGFEFVGSSVLCQSENQFLNEQAQQVQTGKSEGANRVFAETFTSKFEELARQDLVFADLKNVFDLALVASLLQHEGAADRVGLDYGVFANDGPYHPFAHNAPSEVDSVVNHRVFGGRDIVVQVAGGVRADLTQVLENDAVRKVGVRLDSTLATARRSSDSSDRRWWWDAK